MQEFSISEQLEFYMKRHPDERTEYRFNSDRFFSGLCTTGLLEEIESEELHLGSYSTAYGTDGVSLA